MKSTTSKLCTINNNKCAILTTSKGRTLALRKKWTVTVERKRDKVSWNKEFPSSKEKWNRDRSDRQKWEGRELKVLSKVLNDLKTIWRFLVFYGLEEPVNGKTKGVVRSSFFFLRRRYGWQHGMQNLRCNFWPFTLSPFKELMTPPLHASVSSSYLPFEIQRWLSLHE